MADVIVTIPKTLWYAWLDEGDLPDEPATDQEYAYWLGGSPPHMRPGDRVYAESVRALVTRETV